MCFAVVAHHVPHTTVPANRPHRPVSAPLKRSPRAETGQPVRTPYGVRGRRLARRLHPCAPAIRPPFDARPSWSSALKPWALPRCAVPPPGFAGNDATIRRKHFPGREEGREKVSAKLGRSGSRSVRRRKSRASSIQHQSCAGRTSKRLDRQAGCMVGIQQAGGSSSGSHPTTARCRPVF